MKLEPGEHTLMATFESSNQAEEALKALKAAGFTEAQMDRIGTFGYKKDGGEDRPFPGPNETSVANAVLKPDRLDGNTRVLMAATPEASGMSASGGPDVPPFLVTIVCHNERVDQAVEIIHKHHGRV